MAGVVLETLSYRKLIPICVVLLVLQIVCFLLGGLIAPAPYTSETVVASRCVDINRTKTGHIPRKFGNNRWLYPRGNKENASQECKLFTEMTEAEQQTLKPHQVVFTMQLPLPREGYILRMSRWFQSITAIFWMDIVHHSAFPQPRRSMITLDVRLGARNEGSDEDEWIEIAHSTERRILECTLDEVKKSEGSRYDCSVLPLFILGSVSYDYYLINVRFPVDAVNGINTDLTNIEDVNLVEIHQNGGFTKIWLYLKTALFPLVLAALIFNWHRIAQLPRRPNLLERVTIALGVVTCWLDFPVDWLTLVCDVPSIMMYVDIREGIFYGTLLCFWLIFAGEHQMDDVARDRVALYWPQLTAAAFGCAVALAFEICERGVQLLHNPFYTLWSTEVGSNIGLAFIILTAIAAGVYFFYLLYMIALIFRNICRKRALLPRMQANRRRFYEGLMFRFYVMLGYTLYCAGMTVSFYIVSQLSEQSWKWDQNQSLEYSSAFFTGVYGMWNFYVITLLLFYAPSHKRKPLSADDTRVLPSAAVDGDNDDVDPDEAGGSAAVNPRTGTAAFTAASGSLTAGESELAAFMRKTAED